MSTTPLVSIVIAVLSEDDWGGRALSSLLSRSLPDIEIICVDGSDTDRDVEGRMAGVDPRIRVVWRQSEVSASEARRIGVGAAEAAYVLFLDANDGLSVEAAAQISTLARQSDADLVGFGTAVRAASPMADAAPQTQLQPEQSSLVDGDIRRQLLAEVALPTGRTWPYLVRADLLRRVYQALPESVPAQSTDLPALFLACAAARTYVFLELPLYRHHSRQGDDSQSVNPIAEFRSAVGAVEALTAIEPVVRDWARHVANPEPLVDGYESARLSAIAKAFELLWSDPEVSASGAAALYGCASKIDVIAAVGTFAPMTLHAIASYSERAELRGGSVHSVLLTTDVLTAAGASNVLLAQVNVLLDSGYRVTIATHRTGSDYTLVPDGATLVEIAGTFRQRLHAWVELCGRDEVDVVIDHRILSSRDWPAYTLAAQASQIPTIGWIDDFAGRTVYDGDELQSLLKRNLNVLAQLVVLSPLDVAFWKMRGIRRVAYLPTPRSSRVNAAAATGAPRVAPGSRRLELIWWGPLEEEAKRASELIEVATALKRLGTDFRLRIVRTHAADLTAARLTAKAAQRDLDGLVEVTGPLHGHDLLDAIDTSDVFISTSAIEGYFPALSDAQSRGLPVVAYDLPWLVELQDNSGVLTVPQGNADALAYAIFDITSIPERYENLSRASVEAAERAESEDFARLYEQLFNDDLPPRFSPEPSLEDGRKILDLLILFAETRSGSKIAKAELARLRRAASSRRRGSARRSPGATVERKLTGLGHRVLAFAPWLRPTARHVKRALLRL